MSFPSESQTTAFVFFSLRLYRGFGKRVLPVNGKSKNLMHNRPNIFGYNDFRAYLNDVFTFYHHQDKKFSKSYVCKRLGLPNSRSYFQDIINGKRLSQTKVPLIIKAFKLSSDEAAFFRVLVNYNQAVNDPQERQQLFEQLIALNRTPKKIMSRNDFDYFTEWYHPVVRAVLNVIDIKDEDGCKLIYKYIFPKVTPAKLRRSIRILREIGLVEANRDGYLKPTDKIITTPEYAEDEILRQYQIKTLGLAQRAILQNREQPQRIKTKTISISKSGYEKILKHLEKFDKELTSLIHKDEGEDEMVCQMNMQVLTNWRKTS